MKTDDLLKNAERNRNESSISFAEEVFADEAQAKSVFTRLKAKLLDIGEWNNHSLMSSYAVFDANGKLFENQTIYVGAFIRVSLAASGKYDWIRVIDSTETADEFKITVKPTFDPTAENVDENVISHFFTDDSTNNFCVCRKGNSTAFYVIGLDEKQNTGETKNALETIRNVAVNLGTYLGIQKGEWEKFCHSLMAEAVEMDKS